ncbi:MAG: polyketide cyclase, partial [Actinomycetota bacterium]|nr:polyketide cyclase [Actinomycetota bacterium]
MNTTGSRYQVSIEADPTLPIIRITRDFDATPA